MTKWVKQLTREGTLLDRSLRMWAYFISVPQVGKARFAKCPNVGRGRIVSWYYDPKDYAATQQIIVKEFSGPHIAPRAKEMVRLLETAYLWAKRNGRSRITRAQFPGFLDQLQKHHAYGRGAIVYSYWGGPAITGQLAKSLAKSVPKKDLDYTLSLLSAPKIIDGPLREIYHPSAKVHRDKSRLLAKLKLDKKQLELVEVLSWFTLFYEVGERVSTHLQKDVEYQLDRLLKNKRERESLNWYDGQSLHAYFKGGKLSKGEIARRREFYMVVIKNNRQELLSGNEAKSYFQKNFPQAAAVKARTKLAGTIASKGKARGRVVIVVTQEDQKKMRKGDILLSPMTTPRLMAAVKKAGAIVTDEGGLTAHAAIVSRELGIPCIVGTKYATQVFKDGDIVEVDADKGTVKLIK